jgi:hypothetical protein
MDICRSDVPVTFPVSAEHWSRCWLLRDESPKL